MEKLLCMLMLGVATSYSMEKLNSNTLNLPLKKLPLLSDKPILSSADIPALVDNLEQPKSLISLSVQALARGIKEDTINLETVITLIENCKDHGFLIKDEIQKDPYHALFLLHDASTSQKAVSLLRLKDILNLSFNRTNFAEQTPFNTHICNNRPSVALTLLYEVGNALDITTPDIYKKSPLQNSIISHFERVAAIILKHLVARKKTNHINTLNCRTESTFELALEYTPNLLSSIIESSYFSLHPIEYHIEQLKNKKKYKEALLIATLFDKFNLTDESMWNSINEPHALYHIENEYSLLMIAILKKRHPRIIQELLNYNAEVNTITAHGWTPLTYAIKTNQPKVVNILLKYNADTSIICENKTVIELTIIYCPTMLSNLLYQLGDKKKDLIDLQNKDGDTPLHIAIKKTNLNAIMALIVSNSDTLIVNKQGLTCFHYAAYNSCLALYALICTLNKDQQKHFINLQDFQGLTPLMWAVEGNNKDTINMLLKEEADITIKDNNGLTALDRARIKGNKKIIALLENEVAYGT